MRKNFVIVDEHWGDMGLIVSDISSTDVDKAKAEWKRYFQKVGKTYKADEMKNPSVSGFFRYYFGDYNPEDDYAEFPKMPMKYECTQKVVADKLLPLVQHLAFRSSLESCGCAVEQDGKTITVTYFEW